MFERIKCYRNLKDAEKINKGAIAMGQALNDNEMVDCGIENLKKIRTIRKKIIFDRQMAVNYNLEILRHGF